MRALFGALVLLAGVFGCGEPVRGIDADAKAAKAQANAAVRAAEDAARRVEALSRPSGDPADAERPARDE